MKSKETDKKTTNKSNNTTESRTDKKIQRKSAILNDNKYKSFGVRRTIDVLDSETTPDPVKFGPDPGL